jgi:hypothetical protein
VRLEILLRTVKWFQTACAYLLLLCTPAPLAARASDLSDVQSFFAGRMLQAAPDAERRLTAILSGAPCPQATWTRSKFWTMGDAVGGM